eukprot:PITA_00960
MYATVSLKEYKEAAATNRNTHQGGVLFPPPEGPYSAYLVFQQNEDVGDYEQGACCWGCCYGIELRELPFPQDKCLTTLYRTGIGRDSHTHTNRVYFIPVLGQPISSNRYYVVQAESKYKGLVETCSTEEDMTKFCICRRIKDLRPRSLEPNNPYQQIQVIQKTRGFTSKCMASDGFPSQFLRKDGRDGWSLSTEDLRGKHDRLPFVQGENAYLRAQLPPSNFSFSEKRSPIVIVGEWYCPFIFIKELGGSYKDPKIQLMETPFYKMELEKFWEEIYRTEVSAPGEDIVVQRTTRVEEPLLFGTQAVEEIRDDDGSVWMKGIMQEKGKLMGVRLSCPIIAKIRTDQGRQGLEATSRDVRVEKLFSNSGTGRKFVCYVVVERYVLKRMDGSVALTYSFRNCNQIEGKWE